MGKPVQRAGIQQEGSPGSSVAGSSAYSSQPTNCREEEQGGELGSRGLLPVAVETGLVQQVPSPLNKHTGGPNGGGRNPGYTTPLKYRPTARRALFVLKAKLSKDVLPFGIFVRGKEREAGRSQFGGSFLCFSVLLEGRWLLLRLLLLLRWRHRKRRPAVLCPAVLGAGPHFLPVFWEEPVRIVPKPGETILTAGRRETGARMRKSILASLPPQSRGCPCYLPPPLC